MSYFKQLDILKQEWLDSDISIDPGVVAGNQMWRNMNIDRALGVDIVQQLEQVAKVSHDIDTDIPFYNKHQTPCTK